MDSSIYDHKGVCTYLKNVFRKKRTTKPSSVYKNLSRIYEAYPELIKKVIDELHNLGYWKDYLHLLAASEDQELNNYIYDLLVNQLKKDGEVPNKSKITTLAKWLPREKSYFDKRLNFIDNFNQRLYPGMETFAARRRYRKLVSALNAKIGVAEVNLSLKQYGNVDFEKIAPICFKNNYGKFKEHCPEKLRGHLLQKYATMPINKFGKVLYKRCTTDKTDDFEKDIMEQAWRIKRFSDTEKKRCTLLVDLSSQTFKNISEIICPILIAAESANKIYVNDVEPRILNLNSVDRPLFEKTRLIINSCTPKRALAIKKIPERPLLIISHQEGLVAPDIEYFEFQDEQLPKIDSIIQNHNFRESSVMRVSICIILMLTLLLIKINIIIIGDPPSSEFICH